MEADVLRTPRAPRSLRRCSSLHVSALAEPVLAVLLALSQVAIPAIATYRLTDSPVSQLPGVRASLSAFAAFMLLFRAADSVKVRIGKMIAGTGRVEGLLARAADIGSLDARVRDLYAKGLLLTNASLEKRTNMVVATGTVTRSVIQTLLPPNLVLSRRTAGSNGLSVHGKITVRGHELGASAEVPAENGRIVLPPIALGRVSLLDVLHITVFDRSSVWVDCGDAVRHGTTDKLRASARYR